MRITFVLPQACLAGGVRVVAIYADRLQKLGHQVFVVSTPPEQPTIRQQFFSLLKGQGLLPTQPVYPSHFDELAVHHQVIDRYRPVVDADIPDADVVVATWWETAEWVARLSPSKGAKAYFIQHHEVFDYLPQARVKATYSLPLHKITISRWLVDLMQHEYGDRHVSLVPNSVDTEQFYAPRRSRQATPTVGMLYSSIPWKGCDISLKAFAIAQQRIPNLKLAAFGTTLPSETLPLPANAEYTCQPEQQRLREIYSNCDVWLCGSWSEGFHLPPLEAMACRCPVVSTAVGGSVDVIEAGVNGYTVPVGDADGLAQRLFEVLERSPEDWQTLSDAAYQTAVQYTWDDATIKFEAALQTVIARERSPEFASPSASS